MYVYIYVRMYVYICDWVLTTTVACSTRSSSAVEPLLQDLTAAINRLLGHTGQTDAFHKYIYIYIYRRLTGRDLARPAPPRPLLKLESIFYGPGSRPDQRTSPGGNRNNHTHTHICSCIYIYVHLYIHIHTDIYISVYELTFMCGADEQTNYICLYVCIYIRMMHVCLHGCPLPGSRVLCSCRG